MKKLPKSHEIDSLIKPRLLDNPDHHKTYKPPEIKSSMTDQDQSYYREAYEQVSDAYDRAQHMPNADPALLDFRKYITPQGIIFPNIIVECAFREKVGCKSTDSPQQMVLRYSTALNQTFERRHPESPGELERGLAG